MNCPSFNMLTEPWIPVIRSDGSREELGILSCLEQAPNLREIRDAAPIIEFGLYRLLVAFVLDALIFADCRPEDPADLKNLINNGRFESRVIVSYINQCGDVFDLFHPDRPFLQTKMNKAESKPLAGLFSVTPSGTNAIHWHHEPEASLKVPVQEAARLLTTIAPFMTAGGAGLSPSINGAPALYALPMGRNVFETIVLNIPLRKDQDSGNGAVAWRNTRTPGQERSQATTVESLTWRPRKIQLVPETGDNNNVSVRKMKFAKGDSTRLTWIDASLAHRYDKEKVTPIRMREGRPLWRDAGPLLLLNEGEHGKGTRKISFRRPDVVERAFVIVDTDAPLIIQVYGMRTDMKMKVFEWAKSAWSMPSKLGRSTRLGNLVQHELNCSDIAARGLREAILALAPEFQREERKPAGKRKAWDKRSIRNLADRCECAYWQHLESNFYPLMNAFAALDPNAPDDPALIKSTAGDWRAAIRDFAFEQFESVAEGMDADGNALERQVHARTRLNNRLKEVQTR